MALGKGDKSSIHSIDEPIVKLCEKINSSDDYFTTSSCSGRIVLIRDEVKKMPGLFLFRSHDKISFGELRKELDKLVSEKIEGTVLFKQEPCLIVVSCVDAESQWKLFSAARNNGWKKSGILSIDKKRLVELMSSENISFPVYADGKVLVDDDFLKVVLEKANGNLEKCWGKIDRLVKLI